MAHNGDMLMRQLGTIGVKTNNKQQKACPRVGAHQHQKQVQVHKILDFVFVEYGSVGLAIMKKV